MIAFLRFIRLLTNVAAFLGAFAVVAMLVHITVDVTTSALFRRPLPATNEIVSRYWMVMAGFLALAWSDRRGEAITVEILAKPLSGRLRLPNRIFVLGLTALAYVILTWTSWHEAVGEWESGTYVMALQIPVPVWAGYFVLPLAFGLAFVVTVGRAVAEATGNAHVLAGEPVAEVEHPQ